MADFEVIVVGAGLSGIVAAACYLQRHPQCNITIHEQDYCLGGVWSARRIYPSFWTQWAYGIAEFADFPMVRPPEEDCMNDLFRAKYTCKYLEDYVNYVKSLLIPVHVDFMPRPSPHKRSLLLSSNSYRSFLGQQDIPDPPFTDVAQCRGLVSFADILLLKSLPELPPKLEEFIVKIPAGNDKNHTNTAEIVQPNVSEGRGPLIVLFHPSGFFVPSTAKLILHARGLASLFNATVVSPRYRLAPEHPFPAGINDAWAAVQWAAESIDKLNVDVKKGFIIGGISSGANFAVATARRAIEEGLPVRVTGVWAPLFVGFGLADQDGIAEGVPEEFRSLCTSRVQNCDATVISSTKARDLFAHLRPIFRSPLFNPLADLKSFGLSAFPPTYLQVAGADYFRDDSLILASALRSHGVDVRLDFYPGMTHSFWLYAAHLKQSQKCFRDIVVGFSWLLGMHVETLEKEWETVLVNMGCEVDLNAAAAECETRE